jgi:diguanylate cyclase (GGDEF)-like protein
MSEVSVVKRAPTAIQDHASRLAVVDALVFRRLSATTWAHLGGLGRGRGWAGLIELDAHAERSFDRVPAQPGDVHLLASPTGRRILGPYYACAAALVRLHEDVVVVLGNPDGPLAADRAGLLDLAGTVERELEEIAPSKRLADELEVLHAVRAVTTGVAVDLPGTLQHILDVAVRALSCEVGVLRDGSGRTVTTSRWPGIDLADPAVSAALDELERRAAGGSLCLQEVGEDPALRPLDRTRGVHSLLAVSLPAPVGGLLVTAHTQAAPRGFTDLCRHLGAQVADAAGVVAHTAALRAELQAAVTEQTRAARRDALTGVGNRLCWDEALVEAQQRVDAGAVATVITLDVDGLKQVNDTHGHEAGDRLLRRCADVLRERSRDGDVVVRLGGDEFALLLPVDRPQAEDRLAGLRTALCGVTSSAGTVGASLGMATASCGGSVADAVREADAAMYQAKRARRGTLSTPAAAVGSPAGPAALVG